MRGTHVIYRVKIVFVEDMQCILCLLIESVIYNCTRARLGISIFQRRIENDEQCECHFFVLDNEC